MDLRFLKSFSERRSYRAERQPTSEEITQGDIILVYAAFRRCMHRFSVLYDAQGCPDERCHSDYGEIFRHVKKFFVDKGEMLFKDQKYLEQDDLKESFACAGSSSLDLNLQVENFPTLLRVADSEIHAVSKHDPSNFFLALSIQPVQDVEYFFGSLDFDFMRRKTVRKDIKPYNIEECMQWMPPLMRETILSIPESERLEWIVSLLLTYHYDNECKIFVSCALKFCLRASDMCQIVSQSSPYKVYETLTQYISAIRDFECSTQLLINCLRVLCFKSGVWYHFLKQPLLLKFVLERLQTAEVSLTDVFRKRSWFSLKGVDFCFLKQLNSYTIFLEFGATNSYFPAIHKEIREAIQGRIRRSYTFNPNKKTFRCLQVLYLMYRTPNLSKSEKDRILQTIWASIPEPFLITKDMVECCIQIHSERGGIVSKPPQWMLRVWFWYKTIVINGEIECKSPRRLQHLSRCVIRSYLPIPINVNSLQLPNSLKDYLLLKE